MKRILLLSAFLFYVVMPISFAQNLRVVEGRVVNDDGAPLEGAIITVKNYKQTFSSDEYGNFSIKIPYGYNYISASHPDFSSASAEIDGSFLLLKLKYDAYAVKLRKAAKIKAQQDSINAANAAFMAERERLAAEEKIRKEAEAKARAEAKNAANAERERLATEEKLRKEAEAKARAEAEIAANAERERLAAEERMRKEAEPKARAEAEIAANAERERLAAEERMRKEAEAKARAEAKHRANAEKERLAAEERALKEVVAKARAEAEIAANAERERLAAEERALKEVVAKARAEAETAANAEKERLAARDKTASYILNVSDVVDLGLSVKWASSNLGASKPTEYGGYYQWSGTKDVFDRNIYLDWNNCLYHTGSDKYTSWEKYNTKSSYGTVDNKTVLESMDDAASVVLGGNWRMPTDEEWEELRNPDNCSWKWTTIDGVKGYKVQSKKPGYSDNWIFLPAAGCRNKDGLEFAKSSGCYWSSSVNTDNPHYAYYMFFNSSHFGGSNNNRYAGHSVRPVLE